MKKLSFRLCIILVILLSFSYCGYNKIMYDHLCDESNYKEYTATIVDIFYEYDKNVLSDSFEIARITDAKCVYLDVSFESKEEIAHFYGVSEDSLGKDISEYIVRLEIISKNNELLFQNGFYDNVKIGYTVELKASSLIYQDGEFFYVSSIFYDGVEYLAEAEGLENIINMINKKRSLF